MWVETAVVDRQGGRRLGTAQSVVAFEEGEVRAGGWGGERYLSIHGRRAFDLSFWCGTCPFVFERHDGANQTLSIEDATQRLNTGLTAISDEIIELFGGLLPEGDYLPLLLRVSPRLVHPSSEGDYFSHEQVDTWGVDPFWGLPLYPRTPYYRTPPRPIDEYATLFEFVVPLVPPSWNTAARVTEHAERLGQSSLPTCIALGVLDVRRRADGDTPAQRHAHHALAHFLLDGHHKIEAAATTGRALQVLSLVSLDHSLASRGDLENLPEILAAQPDAET